MRTISPEMPAAIVDPVMCSEDEMAMCIAVLLGKLLQHSPDIPFLSVSDMSFIRQFTGLEDSGDPSRKLSDCGVNIPIEVSSSPDTPIFNPAQSVSPSVLSQSVPVTSTLPTTLSEMPNKEDSLPPLNPTVLSSSTLSHPCLSVSGNSDLEEVAFREDLSYEQLIVAIEDLEQRSGTVVSTPLPWYTTNPSTDSGCISLKTLRDSDVTFRRPKKKQLAKGRHVNPSLASCVPLSVHLAEHIPAIHSPSTVPGALRDMLPSNGAP